MPSQSNLITKLSDFNTDAVHFGQSKPNTRGGKNVPLFDSKGNKLVIALPTTPCWGMNENIDEQSGRKSYSINLRLENGSDFTDKFQNLEDWVIAQCVANGREWFGKPNMSEDVVRALFYPKDRVSGEPDTSRNPSVKLKVGYWEGEFKVELYSMSGQPLFTQSHKVEDESPIDLVPINSDIKALIQCDGLWFTAGRCGITFKLLQAKVEEPVRLEGGCFLDDTDEEGDGSPSVEHEVTEVVSNANNETVDSDSNEASASIDMESEQPKPKRKRKVVKKAEN